MITSFKKEPYKFLSNFYPAKVMLDNEIYSTVEHAYNAAKTTSNAIRINIRLAKTPGIAKGIGRTVVLRSGWNDIKLEMMERLLRQKFLIPELRNKLIATGNEELIEGNWWGDTYWGVCRGKGENHLGILLMKIRTNL